MQAFRRSVSSCFLFLQPQDIHHQVPHRAPATVDPTGGARRGVERDARLGDELEQGMRGGRRCDARGIEQAVGGYEHGKTEDQTKPASLSAASQGGTYGAGGETESQQESKPALAEWGAA